MRVRDLVAFWRETSPADMRAIFEAIYDPAIEIAWVEHEPGFRTLQRHRRSDGGPSTSGWRETTSSL